jgi:hypothetical protein
VNIRHQPPALSTAISNKIKPASFDVVKLPVRITPRAVSQELKVLRTLSQEGIAGGWMAEESTRELSSSSPPPLQDKALKEIHAILTETLACFLPGRTKDLAASLYLITQWSRVLQKLTGFQLVKKFSAFYGTRRLFTAFASTRHLSQS